MKDGREGGKRRAKKVVRLGRKKARRWMSEGGEWVWSGGGEEESRIRRGKAVHKSVCD